MLVDPSMYQQVNTLMVQYMQLDKLRKVTQDISLSLYLNNEQ